MSAPKATCPGCRLPKTECSCDYEEEGEVEADELTPEIARELAAASVAALKPGDVLAVRVPYPIRADEMRRLLDYAGKVEADTGVKVAFIPGVEFSHVTLNVTVNVSGADPQLIAEAVRREIAAQVRAVRVLDQGARATMTA